MSTKANHQPFAHVAFRGESPESAGTYISTNPNTGYPVGYAGRINGVVTTDQAALRKEWFAILAEVY